MELSENLNEAASFTGKLLNDLGNLILLIVLDLIPIVNLIVVGYTAKIIRESPEEPPKLSDYGKLFIDGLLVALAVLIYSLIPIIIMIAGIFVSSPFPAWAYPGRMLPSFPILASLPFIVIGLVLLFVFMIMGVMAIGNMIRTGDFSKIFAFNENWELIKRLGFGKYLLWLIVMFIILLIVGAIGSVIPWVGSAIAGVFFSVFLGKSLASILNEVRGPS